MTDIQGLNGLGIVGILECKCYSDWLSDLLVCSLNWTGAIRKV